MVPFWISTSGSELLQGDYLPDCTVPKLPDDYRAGDLESVLSKQTAQLIVVTQSCDLARSVNGFAALCRIHTLPQFEAINLGFARKGMWEEVRKGRREGLHLLGSPTKPSSSREALVVDFRELFSLPITYLKVHAATLGPRWRLQSPFLEHFSQAFARFFMRVGLPSAIPPFPD